jgi:predicted MFS family arabinose efflux permease
VGSALGSYAGGLIHDVTGSYTAFILAGAALSGVAAFMSWAISEVPAPRGDVAAA